PPPQATTPVPWLLGELCISIGAPFAVLSATAPLLQAWYVRAHHGEARASNLGSMLSLLCYPVLIEPLLPLKAQGDLWSWVYVGFCVLVLALTPSLWR